MRYAKTLLVVASIVLASCAADGPRPNDPVSGRWSGDWGSDDVRRDPVMVELQWDGTNLRGTVNPGRNGLDLTKAAFNETTGAITMEFDAFNNGIRVHFTANGKVEGTTMSGTWKREAASGDFRLTKD